MHLPHALLIAFKILYPQELNVPNNILGFLIICTFLRQYIQLYVHISPQHFVMHALQLPVICIYAVRLHVRVYISRLYLNLNKREYLFSTVWRTAMFGCPESTTKMLDASALLHTVSIVYMLQLTTCLYSCSSCQELLLYSYRQKQALVNHSQLYYNFQLLEK